MGLPDYSVEPGRRHRLGPILPVLGIAQAVANG
jgi:hypothetical protein